MPRDSELIKIRNLKILKMYETLLNKEVKGIRVYSHEYILQQISEQFHIRPTTIVKIVKAT
jgi:hypothetical protein